MIFSIEAGMSAPLFLLFVILLAITNLRHFQILELFIILACFLNLEFGLYWGVCWRFASLSRKALICEHRSGGAYIEYVSNEVQKIKALRPR
jgi:hypothetical protein